MFAKQQYKQDSPDDDDELISSYYIQFSHAFQRHVVHFSSSSLHRPTNRNGNDDSTRKREDGSVVRSYQFLDEALSYYPKARVLPPLDMPYLPSSCFSNNNSSCSNDVDTTTIAGMGLWTLCDLDYNNNADIVANDRSQVNIDNIASSSMSGDGSSGDCSSITTTA
jgi:hypothetical protein